MTEVTLDQRKLRDLASHPGTFPEMVQAVYDAGLRDGKKAGKEEGRRDRDAETAKRHRDKRRMVWTLSFFSMTIVAGLSLVRRVRE